MDYWVVILRSVTLILEPKRVLSECALGVNLHPLKCRRHISSYVTKRWR